MNKEPLLDNNDDIIDNALESFPFFPIRLVCLIISIANFFLLIFSIINFTDIWIPLANVISLIAFFPIVSIQKRIRVNLAENTYKEYYRYLGIKNGKWHSFKGFTIITITHSQLMHRIGTRYGVNSIDVPSTDFCLNLKKDNYNRLNIAAGSYENIFKKAVALAHRYKVGIIDCSEKPNKKYEYSEIAEKFPDKIL